MNRKELITAIRKRRSFLCVGLDTDPDRIPPCLRGREDAVFEFNRAVIDATAPFCVAYKPNAAFYERLGAAGADALQKTAAYLKNRCPEHLLIIDAKRGDIGNTARMYAEAFFKGLGADAVTVSPYMGRDSVAPFLEYEGKWAVILALTSNKGSEDFQTIEDREGERLFERVIRKSASWGTAGNIMFVVGATRGALIGAVRKAAPEHFLLVPGVGAQGGSLEEVCRYGMTSDCGLLVNSSRGIIYAGAGGDFAEAAGEAAEALQRRMSQALADFAV